MKGILWNIFAKVAIFLRNVYQKSGSWRLPKQSVNLSIFLFSGLTFSQIWLTPQVNDHGSNLTKLRGKKKKNTNVQEQWFFSPKNLQFL
jgi:hypothetical protein